MRYLLVLLFLSNVSCANQKAIKGRSEEELVDKISMCTTKLLKAASIPQRLAYNICSCATIKIAKKMTHQQFETAIKTNVDELEDKIVAPIFESCIIEQTKQQTTLN